MKKLILSFGLMVILLFNAFAATTATTSMRLSAYKEEPLPPDLKFTLTVKYQNNENITGMGNIYDISDKVTKETTLYYVGAAFTVAISTTYRTSPEVTLTFTPFINQKNTELSFPVSYTMTKNTPTITGDNKTGGGFFSSSYYYRYTPDMVLKNSSGATVTTVDISEVGTNATLSQTLATIQRSTRKNSGYTTIQESSLPATTNNTLPGLAANQALTSTAYFKLNIDGNDYQSMMANVDYIATVRLTVQAD